MNYNDQSAYSNNAYEMNYMNPPASNPSSGVPIHTPNPNYGFQYTYSTPEGHPPKYEDVMNGTYGQQNACNPTFPTIANPSHQNQNHGFAPPPPYTIHEESTINIEPETRNPPQTETQVQTPKMKEKKKINCCQYCLIRFAIGLIIGGIIRGIVYATYK